MKCIYETYSLYCNIYIEFFFHFPSNPEEYPEVIRKQIGHFCKWKILIDLTGKLFKGVEVIIMLYFVAEYYFNANRVHIVGRKKTYF